jgi:hypothetical protein
VILDYEDKPDEWWALNPPKFLFAFNAPVDQIIPLDNGKLFFVDYADQTTDELWRAETQSVVTKLDGLDIAPPPDEKANPQIPNFVLLENGTFFLLKYEADKPSQLWETASTRPIVTLDGDMERVVPLDDRHFFVRYADPQKPSGVWEIGSRKLIAPAEDVVTEDYDNRILALRRNQQFDEIWRTDPWRKLTSVVGRVETVTTIQGSNYFLLQYEGGKAAEIWLDDTESKLVQTLRGPLDTSITYLNRQYFFFRYNDQSTSEIWSVNPLKVVASLNGHLAATDIKAVLGQEVVIIQYQDNAISELWSLKEEKLLAKLSGDAISILPLQGDTFFAVRYRDNVPAEVWSAIGPQRIGTLGDGQKTVTSITAMKDGSILIVTYAEAPTEIWDVGISEIKLAAKLPRIATKVYPIGKSDYFILNTQGSPAQIWQLGKASALLSLKGSIQDTEFNLETNRLTYTTVEQTVHTLNMTMFNNIFSAGAEVPEADLLTLACDEIAQMPPLVNESLLTAYLGGLNPSACQPAPADTPGGTPTPTG